MIALNIGLYVIVALLSGLLNRVFSAWLVGHTDLIKFV